MSDAWNWHRSFVRLESKHSCGRKRIFQRQTGRGGHTGTHIIPTMYTLQTTQKGGLTSTPLRSCSKGWGGQHGLLPQQKKARESLMNTTTCPPGHKMQMATQEFCKLHEPKVNKLKGGYSATANLIFQSWLKDIQVHVEDQNLTQREAMQLIKDFTAECDHAMR